jgi:hypothetical protein
MRRPLRIALTPSDRPPSDRPAQVSAADGTTTGVALVEIYELPE